MALASTGFVIARFDPFLGIDTEMVQEPDLTAIYIAETGHHITGPILNWWLQYGRDSTIGWPITEPLAHGTETVQYFERGALRTDVSTADPLGVVPVNLGTSWALRLQPDDVPHDYKWWFPQSQRGVHPAFWDSYRERGGAFTYGYPILWGSESGGRLRQPFSRSVWTETSQGVVEEPVGRWAAAARGLSTNPTQQSRQSPRYEANYWPIPGQYGSDRRAEVDLGRQTASFFASDTLVYQALISTGRPPDFTPAGEYRIFSRHERTRLVSNGSTFKTYNIPDVLHVQYFTKRWIGFHYAYWHDEFGRVWSAGCINMRLDDARWAWDFCRYGMRVIVRPPVPAG